MSILILYSQYNEAYFVLLMLRVDDRSVRLIISTAASILFYIHVGMSEKHYYIDVYCILIAQQQQRNREDDR
jgi:hypothetical protein